MGLLPLEFTDCLQDSPFFRDSLQSHEKELERTSQNIKDLIKEVKNLLNAAKTLSSAQRRLSQHLVNFKFECIGSNQTDEEMVIAGSLKEFGRLISVIEDEKDRMLDRAYEQFIEPLETFRKEHIGAVKERKKKFEKQTAKFCASQERYLSLSTKKQDNVLQEADAILEMEQRDFIRAGLEYVCLIQEVQERKKFEFVEILLGFMYSWLTFYHQGHEVALDFKPSMTELQTKIQKTRENFNASRQNIAALMRKMLEIRQTKPVDPGTLNKMYTRSGYLFLMEKKALGTGWTKCYCQYQRENRVFSMIPYNQTTGKLVSNETIRLKTCVRRVADSIDKRFCFDVTAEDKPGVVYTLQAQSEDDRKLWMDAMEGTEPMFVHPPKPSNADQTYLDESGSNFVERCFRVLESRGLEDQGLYRVVGVSSKVTKLLTIGLDRRKSEKLHLEDAMEWESKTITSAIKTFFRNLPEPIMTFKLHRSFIAAAKLETYHDRVSEIHRLVCLLPEPSKRMLELLCAHLEKIAANSSKNMMSVSNLGVCFGPTLLRDEEETVAAIMDIKFGNVVVEILIHNWKHILRGEAPHPSAAPTMAPYAAGPGITGGEQLSSQRRPSASSLPSPGSAHHMQQQALTVLPLPSAGSGVGAAGLTKPPSFVGAGVGALSPARLGSPPGGGGHAPPPHHAAARAPPPYHHPPPPAAGTAAGGAMLAHAVIYNNGPKQVQITTKSPASASSGHSPPRGGGGDGLGRPPPPGQPTSAAATQYNSATWERTLRMSGGGGGPTSASQSNLVAPPLGSAPAAAAASASPQRPSAVHASLSNLSNATASTPPRNMSVYSAGHSPPQPQQTLEDGGWYRGGGAAKAKPGGPPPQLQLQRQLSAGGGGASAAAAQHGGSGLSVASSVPSKLDSSDAQLLRGGGGGGAADDSSSMLSEPADAAAAATNASPRFAASSTSSHHRPPDDSGRCFSSDWPPPLASSAAETAAAAAAADNGRFAAPGPERPARTTSRDSSDSSMESVGSFGSSGREADDAAAAKTAAAAAAPAHLRPSRSLLPLSKKAPSLDLRKVRTLYACVGEHESELSFEPNQIITSVRPSLEPGWLEGCLDGKVGLVPENYVEYF